jgi:hypothetical protein
MSDQESEKSGLSGFKPFIIIFAILVAVLVLFKVALSVIM